MAESTGPLIAPYQGVSPVIGSPLVYGGARSVVLGRATLGSGAWLGNQSVIRADGHFIKIGDDFHLGENATVHIAEAVYPTRIGHRVTTGHNAVIHACTINDDCLIESEAVVLDGATVGAGSVISAGSIVFPRATLEPGWIYSGSPAQAIARISVEDLAAHHSAVRSKAANTSLPESACPQTHLDCFVAPTATIHGNVMAAEEVGIWYACALNANSKRIEIGPGSNVQDNSIISCATSDVILGANVTVGHNVILEDCRIGDKSLIGIGCRIAQGSSVDSDVLVAAGSETEPGQHLSGGQFWAGRPARAIEPMTEKRRQMLCNTLSTYRLYAQRFRHIQHSVFQRSKEE